MVVLAIKGSLVYKKSVYAVCFVATMRLVDVYALKEIFSSLTMGRLMLQIAILSMSRGIPLIAEELH